MLEKLNDIIREYKGDNSINIGLSTLIKEDLEMSSFDLIQLACELEDEFAVEVPDRAIKDFITIADVVAFIDG